MNEMIDYEKIAKEFLEKQMQRGPAHPPFEKFQMFTKGERFALFHLMQSGGKITPGEITDATHTSSARVAMVLKSLEAKGYIKRDMDQRDRRKVLVSVTEAGRKIITEEQEDFVKNIATIFKRMGENDTKEFLRLFSMFFGYMSEGKLSCCPATPRNESCES